MPVTERLILPTTGGVDAWREPVKFLLQTLKAQEGNIRTRWGPHSENPDNLEFLIGWESTTAQTTFQSSPAFTAVQDQLKPVLTGAPVNYFLEFKPYAPKEVIDSPFVQCLTISGSAQAEDALRAAVEAYKAVPGCNGAASGFSLADVPGQGGKVFVAVVGWASLEESASGRSSVSVDVGGSQEVHHVNFRFPVKGFRGL